MTSALSPDPWGIEGGEESIGDDMPASVAERHLRNLVRLHSYEITAVVHPNLTAEFPARFAEWEPPSAEQSPVSSRRHPIHKIADRLHAYFSSGSCDGTTIGNSDYGLEILVGDIKDSTGEAALEVGERLEMQRYDYWGSNSEPAEGLKDFDSPNIIGSSRPWLEVLQLAARAARCEFPVLLTGETGTGKDLLARAIHSSSRRSGGNCVVINCAALPVELVESELFGYGGGAFTGALAEGKPGRFEDAAGGTLVLDEVADLPAKAQAALLRALQNGELQKVGGKMVHADFRLICITSRSLESAVASGRFRLDLYYRISVVPIHLPPLRERAGDIPLFAEHFLGNFNGSNRELTARRLSAAAKRRLQRYKWPGNVRELENVIARSMVLCGGKVIGPEHIIFAAMERQSIGDSLAERVREALGGAAERSDPGEVAQFLGENRSHITTGGFAKRFHCGETTARRRLKALREAGLLIRSGSKKGSHYTLNG